MKAACARYLVSVSGHKFRALWARKLILPNPDLMSYVVAAPYSEFGLHI